MKYVFFLPAYKTTFLEKSIKSILSQTYKDFILLVSDDCSPNNVKGIIDKFNDSRLIYRRNDHNIGAEKLVQHWNLLVNEYGSDAEYCIMASDDDVYAPNFLKEVDAKTKKYVGINILRSSVKRIDANDNVLSIENKIEKDRLSINEFETLLAQYKVFSGLSPYVFKLSFLQNIGGFVDFPLAWYSDDATVAKMAKGDNMYGGGEGISIVSSSSVQIRMSNDTISCGFVSGDNIKKKIIASIFYMDYITSLFSDTDVELTLRLNLIRRARKTTIDELNNLKGKDYWKVIGYMLRIGSGYYRPYWILWRICAYCLRNCLRN